jgi:hypothetical protein
MIANNEFSDDDQNDLAGIPHCRVCGCTDYHACPGGCYWVEDPEGMGDLCSQCFDKLYGQAAPAAESVKGDD